MGKKSKEELVDGVLASEKKFRRALVVIIALIIGLCFCVYNGDKIADIITAWNGAPRAEKAGN